MVAFPTVNRLVKVRVFPEPPKMKQKKHQFKFKKTISIGYLYTKETTESQKRVLQEHCLEGIRKRFKWLSELSDEELIKHLE